MEERINELERKIDGNMDRIIANMEKLHSHEERINKNTGALDVLSAIKTYNNRFFGMWIVTFLALLVSLGLNFYLLNDITSVETTTQQVEQETNNGSNNFIGGDGDING